MQHPLHNLFQGELLGVSLDPTPPNWWAKRPSGVVGTECYWTSTFMLGAASASCNCTHFGPRCTPAVAIDSVSDSQPHTICVLVSLVDSVPVSHEGRTCNCRLLVWLADCSPVPTRLSCSLVWVEWGFLTCDHKYLSLARNQITKSTSIRISSTQSRYDPLPRARSVLQVTYLYNICTYRVGT